VHQAPSPLPKANSFGCLVHVRSSLIQGLFLLPARVAEIAMMALTGYGMAVTTKGSKRFACPPDFVSSTRPLALIESVHY